MSIPQVIQRRTSKNENNLVRHYILHGEITLKINKKFDLVPGSMIRKVSGAPMQFDLNAKGLYLKKYWIGFSYRHNDAIISMLGLMYKNMRIGYAYDFIMTDIRSYSAGTHEFHLGLNIAGKKRKGDQHQLIPINFF